MISDGSWTPFRSRRANIQLIARDWHWTIEQIGHFRPLGLGPLSDQTGPIIKSSAARGGATVEEYGGEDEAGREHGQEVVVGKTPRHRDACEIENEPRNQKPGGAWDRQWAASDRENARNRSRQRQGHKIQSSGQVPHTGRKAMGVGVGEIEAIKDDICLDRFFEQPVCPEPYEKRPANSNCAGSHADRGPEARNPDCSSGRLSPSPPRHCKPAPGLPGCRV